MKWNSWGEGGGGKHTTKFVDWSPRSLNLHKEESKSVLSGVNN